MIFSEAHTFGLLMASRRLAVAGAAVAVASVVPLFVFAGAANAGPSGSETITTTVPLTSFPNQSGDVATFSGTFSASGTVSDTGTVTNQALFGAVPSPVIAVLQQVRTYSGSKGTLTLRCNERLFPPGQHAKVETQTGSCVVLDATGAYAGLKGSGNLTGTVDSSVTPVTLQDTLVL